MGRSKLQQIYYDPKRVGSYGGVAALRKNVEQWLSEQDAYTLHKPVRRHFKRRCESFNSWIDAKTLVNYSK